MKQLTKILIILIISSILFRLLGYILIPLINGNLSSEIINEMSKTKMFLGTIELFSYYGFNLIIGFILIPLAKRF
jgi:preprotein translocase subunit SecY